jgi:two-component system response regulator AtoC
LASEGDWVARILVIEDEENLRFTIRRSLNKAGHVVDEAAQLRDARQATAKQVYDLVLTDVNLGADNGLEFVREMRAEGFEGAIVVMTAFSNVGDAVSAIRDGADDYISKPLSLEELSLQVGKWIEHRRLARRVELYERIEKSRSRDSELIGHSPRWKATLALADRLAGLPLGNPPPSGGNLGPESGNGSLPCILLTGETGVGKGALARYIHRQATHLITPSTGSGKEATEPPFVHVNCSALPATLVEGELFGHEKGAFTDAREARPGLFEMADGGTIFLDEISEMPLELQSKLLLVVEHGSFRRVGGTKERHVRVRVIAASNQNLDERVKAGTFRRDLLYRLNAFIIKIPPLRDRTDDAVAIAETSLDRLTRRYARPAMTFSDAARSALAAHDWPGNVRELVNSIQRAVMLCDTEVIEPADLGLTAATPFAFVPATGEDDAAAAWSPETSPTSRTLVFDFEHGPHRAEDVERELIMQALKHTHGNVSRAAKLIGMQRSSLRYRIERYHLESFIAEVANR